MNFKELSKFIDDNEWLSIKYQDKPSPNKAGWWDTEGAEDLIELKDALEQFSDWEVESIESECFIYSESRSKLVVYIKEKL